MDGIFDEDSGFMKAFDAGIGDVNTLSGFEKIGYRDITSADQVWQNQKKKNSAIGGIAGAALTPFLGPLAAPLGKLVGGLFGKGKAERRAASAISNRTVKEGNTKSIYQNLSRDMKRTHERDLANQM